jgi:hypothetical protein
LPGLGRVSATDNCVHCHVKYRLLPLGPPETSDF